MHFTSFSFSQRLNRNDGKASVVLWSDHIFFYPQESSHFLKIKKQDEEKSMPPHKNLMVAPLVNSSVNKNEVQCISRVI